MPTPGLDGHAPSWLQPELKDRFLFAEAVDARRCVFEGVLRTAEPGNGGSVLGIGYPAWTGGVLSLAEQHADLRARALAARCGARFESA